MASHLPEKSHSTVCHLSCHLEGRTSVIRLPESLCPRDVLVVSVCEQMLDSLPRVGRLTAPALSQEDTFKTVLLHMCVCVPSL